MAPSSVRAVDVVGQDNQIVGNTKAATSIAELVSTIPQTWRPVLGSIITSTYRASTKLSNVQNTIAQYERHVAEKTFPASISNAVKEPKLQFSIEHRGTEDGKLAEGTIREVIRSARRSVLDTALERKKEELVTLQDIIQFDLKNWRKHILEVAERVAQALGAKVETTSTDETDLKWSSKVAPSVVLDGNTLWKYGNIYHYRSVALARSIADRSLVEKTRTLTLKKQADVEMKDADSEKSTQELVRDELKAQMAALEARLARTIGQSRKSAPPKKKGGSNPSGVRKNSSPKNGKKKAKGKR